MNYKEAMKEAKQGTMVTCKELGESAIGVCRDHQEYLILESEGKDALSEVTLLVHTVNGTQVFKSNPELEKSEWDFIRSI